MVVVMMSGLAAPAQGAPITWTLTGNAGQCTGFPPKPFSTTCTAPGGEQLIASGFTAFPFAPTVGGTIGSPAAAKLTQNSAGGLGVLPGPNNAIDPNEYIMLDLPSGGSVSAITVSLKNAGRSDNFEVYGSLTANTGLTSLLVASGVTSINPQTFVLPSNSAQFLYVVGRSGAQFRLNALTAESIDSIPEPAALAILGLGLAGLGFVRRRRRA